jgi:hypothetical protein
MTPVYISVDCEFTDGNLEHGQLMQLAMYDTITHSRWSAIIPITTEARVNGWVREHLPHLVSAALQTAVFGAPAGVYAREAFDWVRNRQLQAFFDWKGLEDELTDPASIADDFPAVMVTYCGGYDFGFISKFFNQAGLENPFHYEMLDISGLALGLFSDLKWGFATAELESILNMEPNERAHDALADAEHQAEMFRRLMKVRKGQQTEKEEPCSQQS